MLSGRTEQAGFTLAELMVTVAIIGVLAAVAIPNYRKFVNKARQTEAKMGLAAVYVAERAGFEALTTYSACLKQLGYAVEGNQKYYTVGFTSSAATNSTCGPTADQACLGFSYTGNIPTSFCTINSDEFTPANIGAASAVTSTQTDLGTVGTVDITSTTYTVQAVGIINPLGGSTDVWQMDQTRTLQNIQPGF